MKDFTLDLFPLVIWVNPQGITNTNFSERSRFFKKTNNSLAVFLPCSLLSSPFCACLFTPSMSICPSPPTPSQNSRFSPPHQLQQHPPPLLRSFQSLEVGMPQNKSPPSCRVSSIVPDTLRFSGTLKGFVLPPFTTAALNELVASLF